MPTYDYHCLKCGQNFEAVQSMKDPHFQVCPKELCRMETWGEGPVKRQLGSGAGLIFKGSGFYITDYRSDSYKQAAKNDSGGGSGGASDAAKPKSEPAAAPKADAPKPSSSSAPKSAD